MTVAAFDPGDSLERGFTELVAWLPNLLGALAILLVGWIVARALGRLVQGALSRAGFDDLLARGAIGRWIRRAVTSPSSLAGTLTFWALFLGAVSIAVDVLGVAALESLVADVWAYLPNVLAALLIFVVALAIAGGVAALAQRFMGDTGLGRIVATAAPILVMTIATFMILDQLQIAETIVTITYAGLVGALALGAALAFGLGGREVAARMLEGVYAKGQEQKDQLRRDLDVGIQRARADAEQRTRDLDTQETTVSGRPSRPRPV